MSTSIFRDRPSDESSSSHRQSSGTSTKQPPSRGPRSDSDLDKNNAKSGKTETLSENDNSPHNILLSLRTPTTSFEENTEKVKLDDNKRDSAERTKGISRKDGDEDDNATIQRHNSTNIYRRSPPNQASDQLYEVRVVYLIAAINFLSDLAIVLIQAFSFCCCYCSIHLDSTKQ
jgi:hypothetical protein